MSRSCECASMATVLKSPASRTKSSPGDPECKSRISTFVLCGLQIAEFSISDVIYCDFVFWDQGEGHR